MDGCEGQHFSLVFIRLQEMEAFWVDHTSQDDVLLLVLIESSVEHLNTFPHLPSSSRV